VEAERTVSVETAGDASAFLALEPARSDSSFVEQTGGTIEIQLDGNNSSADGLNQEARTRFENLVDVTNNGTQDVTTLDLEIEVTGNNINNSQYEEAFKITVGDTTLNPSSGNPVGILDDQDLSQNQGGAQNTLAPGQTAAFGVEINLLDSNTGLDQIDNNADFTLTITAETS
jgi:hypothetical protein